MLKKRNKLSKRQLNEKSRIMAKALLKMPDFRSAEMVMFYAAKGSEVSTWKMIAKALCSKRVALPVTEKKTGKITPYEIVSLNRDLEAGAFGVYEPKKETCGIVKDKEIDLVIVPGSTVPTFTNLVTTNLSAYYTNSPWDPVGTPRNFPPPAWSVAMRS